MVLSTGMQPVSATDAIGAAFTHTRATLAGDRFRLSRFFKLALLAAVTQASFLSVSLTYPVQGAQAMLMAKMRHPSQNFQPGFGISPGLNSGIGSGISFGIGSGLNSGIGGIVGALGFGLLLLVLVFALGMTLLYLYCLCRARASLFDLVLSQGAGRVRDAWRRQARAGRRYFSLFCLALLCFWTILVALLAPVILRLIKVSAGHSGVDATQQASSLILTIAGLVWVLVPFWIAIDALIEDFVLPSLALEPQASLSAALVRAAGLVRRAPGQILLYLVLRTVVAFGVAVALGLVALVGLGLLGLSGWGIGRLLYNLLWTGSVPAHAVFFAVVTALVLALLVLYLLCVLAIYGVTGTFKTSYAAIFYAGRYPELASRLAGPEPLAMPIAAAAPELW